MTGPASASIPGTPVIWTRCTAAVSVTDRYVKFFNLVLTEFHKRHPDVGLRFYCYSQQMRPPVPEKPDLKLLAILAPIDVWRSRFGSGRFRAVSIELEYSPEPERYSRVRHGGLREDRRHHAEPEMSPLARIQAYGPTQSLLG